MIFEVLPTIDIMVDLYNKPRSYERFQEYLKTLQGNTQADLSLPISGYNPMAKEQLVEKLLSLKNLGAEQIIQELVNDLNSHEIYKNINRKIKIALNLSDDLKGGWTNRFTSDYDSKFKINGLISRDFCVPVFWSSELYTEEMIRERTLEYIFRTVYWQLKPKPKTLEEHVAQEQFAAKNITYSAQPLFDSIETLEIFFSQHKKTENYSIIFNFFYGDEASQSLAFPAFGISSDLTGFEYARYLEK